VQVFLDKTRFVAIGRYTPTSLAGQPSASCEPVSVQSINFLKAYVSDDHPYTGTPVNLQPIYTVRSGDAEWSIGTDTMPYDPLAPTFSFDTATFVQNMTHTLHGFCARTFK